MQVVIDMDTVDYEYIKNGCIIPIKIDNHIYDAIRKGIPLPKGHGVLKDADAMINKLCTHEASESFGSVTCAEILDFINDEKPIIEADEAESEDKE